MQDAKIKLSKEPKILHIITASIMIILGYALNQMSAKDYLSLQNLLSYKFLCILLSLSLLAFLYFLALYIHIKKNSKNTENIINPKYSEPQDKHEINNMPPKPHTPQNIQKQYENYRTGILKTLTKQEKDLLSKFIFLKSRYIPIIQDEINSILENKRLIDYGIITIRHSAMPGYILEIDLFAFFYLRQHTRLVE